MAGRALLPVLGHPRAYQSELDFWERAREKVLRDSALTTDMKRDLELQTFGSTASNVIQAAQSARDNYEQRSRDRAPHQYSINKIITSARKFSTIVTSIVAFDLTNHASVVWDGIKFFLNAAADNIQLHELVLESMGIVTQLIADNLELVVKLYFINQPPEIQQLKSIYTLRDKVIDMHAEVLKFLALAKYYYERGSWGRLDMSLEGVENSKIQQVLNSVNRLNGTVLETCAFVDREKSNHGLEGQHIGLAQILSAIENIERQFREQQEFRDRPSSSLLGLNLKSRPSGSNTRLNQDGESSGNLLPVTEALTRLNSSFLDLRDIAQTTNKKVTDIEATLMNVRRSKILHWISPEPYQLYHQQREPFNGVVSCNPVRYHREFNLWYGKRTSSLLWLHGIPGCGKTTIVSAAIEYIKSEFCGRSNMVVYYYCQSKNNQQPRESHIIASLIRQLVAPSNPISPEVESKYKEAEMSGFSAGPFMNLGYPLALFEELASERATGTTFIFIDGAEKLNMKERDYLVNHLIYLAKKEGHVYKILVSSRSEPYFTTRFRDHSQIRLTAILISENIQSFIKVEVSRLIRHLEVIYSAPPFLLEQERQEIVSAAVAKEWTTFFGLREYLEAEVNKLQVTQFQ